MEEWTSQNPSTAQPKNGGSNPIPSVDQHQDTLGLKTAEKKGKFLQRIKQACNHCGLRRVKCDGQQPCSNCVKANCDCSYKEPKKRGPPKGSSRAYTSKRTATGQEKGSNKSQRRASAADVHSQPGPTLPPHLRAQSGGTHSEFSQSASNSPIEGIESRDTFSHGRLIQPQHGDFMSQDHSHSQVRLSNPTRFDSNHYQLEAVSYNQDDVSRDRDLRSSFNGGGLPPDSRYFVPDQSAPNYYPIGSESRMLPQSYSASPYRPQSRQQSQPQTQTQIYPHFYPQPTSAVDSLSPRLDSNSNYRRQTLNGFAAGSTWQPPTRTNPGPLPVPASASSSANSPSSGSQESSSNRGPLYSHYRGGTSGLGFFDNAKKQRQLPPLDFEGEFNPGGSRRALPSDRNRQLPPILGESNPDTRSSAANTAPEMRKASSASNTGGASQSSPTEASATRVPPPSQSKIALESYDAPENIAFANGSLQAIAQERRRESSKLMMGYKSKHLGETPNMSDTSRDSSTLQSVAPADQKDSPTSAAQTAATASGVKGKEKKAGDSPGSVVAGGDRSNVRRRQNSPDEEEIPLALLDMGGLLEDEIIITASQPRVPSVVMDHLWKIFTYIIHPHWPVLYRPSLGVGDRRHQIDPERQPLLYNSIAAIAAATWEGDIDAPPEIRKASEIDLSSRPAGMTDKEADDLEDANIIMKLNGAQLSTVFFVRARYYLLRTMLEPTLEVIQSLIFMALCESGIGRAVACEQFSSLASRMCLDLGLHRYSEVSRSMGNLLSHEEDQAHRRTFYCCYVLDKHAAAILGRPPVLRWIETDCPFPSTQEQDELENWGEQAQQVLRPETALALRHSPVRSISCATHNAKLSIIMERILAQYNTVKEKLDPELRAETWEGPALRHQLLLEQWERELPDCLRWENPANRLPHVLLLHLWFQIDRIILHRPFILKQSSIPQLPSSHQECTEATARICQILDLYESLFSLRKLSSTFVFILFTASTIALANLTSNDVLVAKTAKRHLRQFMRWLSLISETWPSAGHHLKILEQLGHDIDANLAGTGVEVVAEANFTAGSNTTSNLSSMAQPLEGEVDEQEFVRVHDSSFWEAMPLSSQESVWNNFTSSYLEAINQLRPISDQQMGAIDTNSAQSSIHYDQGQMLSQPPNPQSNLQSQISGSILPFAPRIVRRRHTQSSTLDSALSGIPRFG